MPPETLAFRGGDAALAFAASLLVGGLAIHVAARHRYDVADYSTAVLTALLGAIAWALVEPIPLLGPLLALAAWIAVIKWRYPGDWLDAVVTGVAAWAVAVVTLAALELVGVGSIDALGVPGA